MTYESDLAYCHDAIKHGSLSFHAASKLLPHDVRDSSLALYAFCRVADDEVDLKQDKVTAVQTLIDRVDCVYRGHPRNHPTDRAFAHIVERHDMPRALPEALLEGLAWDAMGHRYDSLNDLYAYSARVASAVGVMMCRIMDVRDRDTLARACDLGVAMQLTNIARDIGEDALERRLYIPQNWFHEAGLDPEEFLDNPQPRQIIRHMARRLLRDADRLYIRSNSGIAHLPVRVRLAIFAARFIYAAIGDAISQNSYDSVTKRARTTRITKGLLVAKSAFCTGQSVIGPSCAMRFAPALPETEFLVTAAADHTPQPKAWSDRFCDIMMELKAQDITT